MSHESQDWVGFDDVNSFLDSLKESNELIEIKDQVSPRFEISALLRELGDQTGPAALFTHVDGFPGHVVAGNLMGHRRRVARALGVQEDQLAATYLERKNRRIPPVVVNDAPLKQVTIDAQAVDLLRVLPALTHHERDVSPYLTCAVTFAKDPETGKQSMGLHRIQVQGSQSLLINLATPPLFHFLQKARELKVSLDAAVVVGPDPAVLIASVTWVPGGHDKVEIAGGFRQRPVEMVQCETVDLMVPAHSQYVIEGTIQPGDMAHEGVFGDSSGTYVEAESPVMKVTSVTHRENPIFQALQPWSSEEDVLLNLCFGSDLLEDVRKDYPFVRDVHLVSGTVCAHIIASVSPCPRPACRSAIIALLTHNPFAKMAIVVDEDIDIRNYREVEWAMAMRFQADRDLILLPGVQGHDIDPSALPDGSSCKMGMDATFPKEQLSVFEKIALPPESKRRSREILNKAIKNFQQGKNR